MSDQLWECFIKNNVEEEETQSLTKIEKDELLRYQNNQSEVENFITMDGNTWVVT
ncbi:hypothetical protein N781_09010 [Pontibacillus halophilus JSM 076056 = DSM 19796]|uniref:Uncharacterized protein n=1 Tax=Pontibacillus halophilus JSM 076056 = DSM 19796 TaxID=1385510 RepID=A0A0A5I1W3_9BACI|nr:hypothetical protein [Pontibacillus halophilus]KGX89847.1 hypothetical protein N781_09010 [Pontibacillus halophilus JSM 076056 = DSM 19796]